MHTHIYTETKKFSNTLQIRIFIKEIHAEITQTESGIFCSKCDYNLIQYQILKKFICMERGACHKLLLKRTKCQYFEHSLRDSETVPDNFGGKSRTIDSP